MSIIISKKGEDTKKIDKSDFKKEDYLQNYIHKNPESIPVYEIEEDKKLFVIKREFPTNSGPIDALAIDKDGDIYIIETKLYKNSDKRTVVAQALDYGSALWRHLNDFDEFIQTLDQQTQKNFELDFQEKIEDFFDLDSKQSEFTLSSMRQNLSNGNLKFVILMDSIDERLKDLIIYVNQNSQFDIYAVQLEYYKFNDYEIIIPKIFGVEVKKNIKTSGSNPRRKWDEQSFILKTKEDLKSEADKIIQVYQYLKEKADKIKWGTGNKNGSFSPIFNNISKSISPFTFYSNGEVMIKFSWLKEHVSKNKLEKYINLFQEELEKETTIKISRDELWNGDPGMSAEEFVENYKGIKSTLEKLVQTFISKK